MSTEQPLPSGAPSDRERALPDGRTIGFVAALVAVCALALVVSPVTFFLVLLLLCIAAAGELYRFVRRSGGVPVPLAGFAAIVGMLGLAYRGPEELIGGAPAVVAGVAAVSLVAFVLRKRIEGAVAGVSSTVAVALTVGLLGAFVMAIRQVAGGFRVASAFLLMVVAGDLSSSLIGRRFGRRPVAGSIGPDKTWEGVAGGIAGVLAAAAVAGATMGEPVTMGRSIVLGVLVAVALPLGDLCGAMITRDGPAPRTAGFFGRGGVLDRLDGLLFAAPLFYFAYRAMVR